MKIIVTGGSGFIGRHLIEHLGDSGYQVVNVDIAPPALTSQSFKSVWRKCSILDGEALTELFEREQPTYVVHLAAFASMDAKSMDEFRANTDGVSNVLSACRRVSSLERLIVTSTQHVRRPGSGPPKSDTDFDSYMLYGKSKVITEELTRNAGLSCAWTIVRPTAVWGAHQLVLADGLWRVMYRGRYFHPSRDRVVRSYGYVRNVVWQMERLLQAERGAVDQKVFYVADGNGLQVEWVNAFARELTGRDVKTIPLVCIRILSWVGDGFQRFGISFPIYSSRFKNLVTSNIVPIEPTMRLLGAPPHSLDAGVNETVTWLKDYYAGKTVKCQSG